MASIGGVTFFTLKGSVPAPSQKTEYLERANVDGFTVRALGETAEPGSVLGGVDVSAAGLAALEESIYALEGTFVSLTLGTGESYSNVFVQRAYCAPARAMARMLGGVSVAEGSNGFWLEAQFEVRRTA